MSLLVFYNHLTWPNEPEVNDVLFNKNYVYVRLEYTTKRAVLQLFNFFSF